MSRMLSATVYLVLRPHPRQLFTLTARLTSRRPALRANAPNDDPRGETMQTTTMARTTPSEAVPVLEDRFLYETDNGAILCGAHCGVQARYTGRDLSGREVVPLTPAEVALFCRLHGVSEACETCRARAARGTA